MAYNNHVFPTDTETKCCGNCLHFYDVDLAGIGKCERAHGGLCESSGGGTCPAFKNAWLEED